MSGRIYVVEYRDENENAFTGYCNSGRELASFLRQIANRAEKDTALTLSVTFSDDLPPIDAGVQREEAAFAKEAGWPE